MLGGEVGWNLTPRLAIAAVCGNHVRWLYEGDGRAARFPNTMGTDIKAFWSTGEWSAFNSLGVMVVAWPRPGLWRVASLPLGAGVEYRSRSGLVFAATAYFVIFLGSELIPGIPWGGLSVGYAFGR